jgi:hypothetical protein
MGINEPVMHLWMRVTTLEYLIGIAEHGKDAADKFYKQFRVNRYINDKSAEDQPIISMSSQLSERVMVIIHTVITYLASLKTYWG